jgi:hypothetical protein
MDGNSPHNRGAGRLSADVRWRRTPGLRAGFQYMRGPLRFGLLFLPFFVGYAAQRRPSLPLVLERSGPTQTLKERLSTPLWA